MQVEILSGQLTDALCDTLIIYLNSDLTVPVGVAGELDKKLNGQISKLIMEQPKMSQFGEITVIHTLGLLPANRIIVAGIGDEKKLSADKLRNLMGTLVRSAKKCGTKALAVSIADLAVSATDAVASLMEGAILGAYEFGAYKTEKKPEANLEKLLFYVSSSSEFSHLANSVEQAKIIADSVLLARDLVNHPASVMTPSKMAWHACEIADKYGLEAIIIDDKEIEELKMNAFLAVAQGTEEPPKLIILKYTGKPDNQEYVAYIGKGITFDSGGISLKPSEGMGEMKTDMAGGAAVLGAMQAISQLKPKVNILAVIPCTENMPSGNSLKPGDVISSMAGKTIEVVNTDAEGRLILADAVTYAKQLGATKLVDLATLTGACVVALGNIASGVVSNNDAWCEKVLVAAGKCGEKMWRLPAFEEYKEQIKSPIADLKNSGGRPAGAITAGLFIAEFADETPWVHIDIAGTATINKDSGYNVKGATGTGVRTLVQLALDIA